MKLFSIRRLIGLGAIYGAVRYARRHGGPKNAFNDLLGKAKEKISEVQDFAAASDKAAHASDFASGRGSFPSKEHLGSANASGGYSGSNGSTRRRSY